MKYQHEETRLSKSIFRHQSRLFLPPSAVGDSLRTKYAAKSYKKHEIDEIAYKLAVFRIISRENVMQPHHFTDNDIGSCPQAQNIFEYAIQWRISP